MASYFIPQMQTLTPSTLFSMYASLSALSMLLRSVLNDLIPAPARDYIFSILTRLFLRRSSHLTIVLEESHATGIGRNHLYDATEAYLSRKITTPSTHRLKVSKSTNDKSPTVRFEKGEQIDDVFEGVSLRWSFCCVESEKRQRDFDEDTDLSPYQTRFFELSFDKEHLNKVMKSYLPHIEAEFKKIKDAEKALKLHTLGSGYRYCGGNVYWDTINLDHPSTFDTLALDPDRKAAITNDLDRFVRRKEFYRRVGRAWKRGYLLYGPPGTGKSSLVAAMANHLKFDIYDLQLESLMKDSDLRRVLLSIPNRSVLVVEDVDCTTMEIKDRRNKSGGSNDNGHGNDNSKTFDSQLSLSGLLNFIDGLWSSCGDERIIVFTTNYKEKLDPALLRPGRMDMHIEMSYLTVQGFHILVSKYLEIKDNHRLFGDIEKLIETINVSPAEVSEELMRSEDADEALEGVIKLLHKKKDERLTSEVVDKPEYANGHANGYCSKLLNGECELKDSE